MTTHKFTFSKDERLSNKPTIDKLFSEGKSAYYPPLRFVFISSPIDGDTFPIRVVFSVPKRNFKRAVDRNLIRRRMREAYRLNKAKFYEQLWASDKKIALMVIYTEKEIKEYNTIANAMVKGMKKTLAKII